MAWLKKNCPRSGEHSHLSLNGGSYSVPASLEKAFLIKYARQAEAGESLHLVEVKTPVFHLFTDLDWTSHTPVAEEVRAEVAAFVAQQAFLIYAPEQTEHTVVVATRHPQQQADGLYKCGMHIHWPGILTDKAAGLVFCHTAQERCREKFGDKVLGEKPWSEIIDEHVYKGSGLRIVMSQKKSPADVYVPSSFFRVQLQEKSGMMHPAIIDCLPCQPQSMQHWVQLCSIRCHGQAKTPLHSCVAEASEMASAATTECSMYKHQPGLDSLRKLLPPCYSSCRFTKLVMGSEKAFIQTDSRVCLNLQPEAGGEPGAHKNNRVYFVVSPEETYQKCYCNCETEEGRVRGPCKYFKSNSFATPLDLANTLFSSAAEPVPFSAGSNPFTSRAATAHEMWEKLSSKPTNPRGRKRAKFGHTKI